MNFFSQLIGSLFHQDYRNPHAQFSRHRNDGYPGSDVAWMAFANRAEEFSELPVLADSRPRTLDEFTSKPPISDVGNRSPIGFISRRVLSRHQAEKACQLADVFNLAWVPNPGHKLTSHQSSQSRESSSDT
jgi:hypothetical protein